jgi:hypothetical protein
MVGMLTSDTRHDGVVPVGVRWQWPALASGVRYGNVRGQGSPP